MKNLRIYVAVLLFVTVAAMTRLYRHIANESFSWERMFSKENMVEVAVINMVVAALLAVVLWIKKKT